jgi:hypothetical protein
MASFRVEVASMDAEDVGVIAMTVEITVTLTDDEAEALTNLLWRALEPSEDYLPFDFIALKSASGKISHAKWYERKVALFP